MIETRARCSFILKGKHEGGFICTYSRGGTMSPVLVVYIINNIRYTPYAVKKTQIFINVMSYLMASYGGPVVSIDYDDNPLLRKI